MSNRLCDPTVIRSIMKRYGFSFDKSLGQNFLIDEAVPAAIAESAGLDEDTCVLEIGPGIGTLTYCDPDSGSYGALGHSVNDSGSKQDMPVRDGTLTQAQVVSVKPGAAGDPGELNGAADLSRVIGNVEKNTDVGIFGKLCESPEGQIMETGEMTAGPAHLICTVRGMERRQFDVEINRVYKDASGTHAMLTVTDPELLSITGGIVQGMSGSPIVQNGKLVGAVTHVFVNDPTRGYGIFIENMLDAAG